MGCVYIWLVGRGYVWLLLCRLCVYVRLVGRGYIWHYDWLWLAIGDLLSNTTSCQIHLLSIVLAMLASTIGYDPLTMIGYRQWDLQRLTTTPTTNCMASLSGYGCYNWLSAMIKPLAMTGYVIYGSYNDWLLLQLDWKWLLSMIGGYWQWPSGDDRLWSAKESNIHGCLNPYRPNSYY